MSPVCTTLSGSLRSQSERQVLPDLGPRQPSGTVPLFLLQQAPRGSACTGHPPLSPRAHRSFFLEALPAEGHGLLHHSAPAAPFGGPFLSPQLRPPAPLPATGRSFADPPCPSHLPPPRLDRCCRTGRRLSGQPERPAPLTFLYFRSAEVAPALGGVTPRRWPPRVSSGVAPRPCLGPGSCA